jgi:hypothetical protein
MAAIVTVRAEDWNHVRERLANDGTRVNEFLFGGFAVLIAHRLLKTLGVV